MINYPEKLEILVDEVIELPIPTKALHLSDISLIQYAMREDMTISDCFDNCHLEADSSHGFGNLLIKGLSKGRYKLEIKKLNIAVLIRVHEGVYWEAEGLIQKKNCILELANDSKFLRISHVDISEENKEAEKSLLSFNINSTSEDTRAHVFAFTYLPDQPMEGYKEMKDIIPEVRDATTFAFTKWENIYQSNRKLGDEYRYVFNRKNAKRFIGNTLEKPQLIMKRLKVRDTTFDNEIIRDGDNYSRINAENDYDLYGGGGGGGGGGGIHRLSNMKRLCKQSDQIYSFQNFLKHATLVHKNLHPDENGRIECEIDSAYYSNVCIIATTNKTCTQVIADIPQSEFKIEKRDLSLTDPLGSENSRSSGSDSN